MSISTESLAEFEQSNRESSRVDTLLPVQFAPNTEVFRSFLKEYYQFLNQKESPSYVISRIIAEHDIDLVVDPLYLEKITYEIARGVPDSPYVQKVFLLKRIIDYYNIRGSNYNSLMVGGIRWPKSMSSRLSKRLTKGRFSMRSI